jgi:hypothetical protein
MNQPNKSHLAQMEDEAIESHAQLCLHLKRVHDVRAIRVMLHTKVVNF